MLNATRFTQPAITIAVGLSIGLAAPGTHAQNATENPPAASATSTNPAQEKAAPMAMGDQAPQGNLTRTHGAWRSSELVGATVFNDKGVTIGTVNDLLIGSDGTIKTVVLSVGQMLGLTSKLVEVPFDKLQIAPSERNPSHAGANGTVSTAPNAPEKSPGGTAGSGAPSAATTTQNHDYGLVLPGATKETLLKLPAFSFTPS